MLSVVGESVSKPLMPGSILEFAEVAIVSYRRFFPLGSSSPTGRKTQMASSALVGMHCYRVTLRFT